MNKTRCEKHRENLTVNLGEPEYGDDFVCVVCVLWNQQQLRRALEYIKKNELISDRGHDVIDKAMASLRD